MIKKFTIGGVDYKVMEVDQILDTFSGKLLFGMHDGASATIKVARHLSEKPINEDVRNITLWHEVLHACLDSMNFSFENSEAEEDFIERLSRALYEYEKTKR